MEIHKVPFEQFSQLSARDIAYATANPSLKPFYKYGVDIDSFAAVIAEKSKQKIPRSLLVENLKDQYSSIPTTNLVLQNIDALAGSNTFTVTTAHQPSLFTGPLYYIYKILSTIHLSELLNLHYPDFQFVPVFISGAEDHDFEEINHCNLFNKTLSWENEETGPVGRMSNASLHPVLEELINILGQSENAQILQKKLRSAYSSDRNYGESAMHLVNSLFQDYGLVVVDMSRKDLKRAFIPILEKELFEQPSKQLVETCQAQLETAGFGAQAHARPINLFYIQDQLRERIEQEDGIFKVVNTNIQFSEAALRTELQEHPERFSPNVITRPLYQEYILPNLAYIGGGGELAYWLERKAQFEHFGIPYPMLIRRNSVLWIDKGSQKRMNKLDLSLQDLLMDTEDLVKRYVKANTENELSLRAEKKQIQELFEGVITKAKEIDPTLVKSVKSEQAKQLNGLSTIEAKLIRAEKQRHDVAINQIRSLKEKFFPNNGLQERHDNFMGLYLKHGPQFFEALKEHLNPLEMGDFVVVME